MLNISNSTRQRLEALAAAENLSVDDFLLACLASKSQTDESKALLDNYENAAWWLDRNYCLVLGNQAFQRNIQAALGREIASGENLLAILAYESVIEEWRGYYNRAFAGESFEIEIPTVYLATERRREYHFKPVQDGQGNIIGASVFGRDVTTEREFETALRQSESRFKLAAQLVGLGIWDWDIASDKTEWYGEMFRIYGISEAEFTGMGTDYIHFTREDYRLKQAANIQNAFKRGITEADILAGKPIPFDPKELCIVRPDGTECFTMGDAIAIVDETGNPIRMLGVTMDISQQRATEEALRVKDSAIESSITAIALADLTGRLTYVNPAFLELWKFETKDAVLGRSVLEFWENPADADAIIAEIQLRQQTRGRMVAKLNDGTIAELELTASLVVDAHGQALCMMGSFTDVSKQVQAEQLRLEQERLKANLKKEQEYNILVQKAVSALAHDIHTPLTVISTTKQILDRYFERLDEESRREKLDKIGKQLNYVLELLNEMSLTVKGRLDERIFQAQALNLPALCQASINEISETIGSKHRLSFYTDGSVEMIEGDETLLSRILLNLLSNAVKFSPIQSEIRLELLQAADKALLKVCDSGMGIAPEELPHIFEPFYRAERVRAIRGTGLGLNIVKDCVERHQGSISVESTVGKGTCFLVELPLQPPL